MKMHTNLMSETMKKIALCGLIAFAAAAAMPASAQQAPSTASQPRMLIETEAEHRAKLAAADRKPGGEGITIHGHWIIDVRNADGSLAEHRDFYNALQADGASALISLLAGNLVSEQMVMGVATTNANSTFGLYIPASAFSLGSTCTNYYTACYGNLVKTFGTTNAYLSSMILSGAIPAQSSAYTVNGVSTLFTGCFNGAITRSAVSPVACNSNISSTNSGYQYGVNNFTAATVSPLAVSAGQSLTVTVTISFS